MSFIRPIWLAKRFILIQVILTSSDPQKPLFCFMIEKLNEFEDFTASATAAADQLRPR